MERGDDRMIEEEKRQKEGRLNRMQREVVTRKDRLGGNDDTDDLI